MSALAFNSIAYANKLKTAGVESRAAEVMAEEMSLALANNLVTTSDLRILELNLKGFIVRSMITVVGFIGSLQTFFHFIK